MVIRSERPSRSSREAAAVSAEPQEGSDMPPLSNFISPGTPGGGTGTAAAGLGGAAIQQILVINGAFGAGRRAADAWNRNALDPFTRQLASVRTPEEFLELWHGYLQTAQSTLSDPR